MQVYKEEAEKLGLSLTQCPHKEKDFSLPAKAGDYRHLLNKPTTLEAELLTYTDPDADLAITELERLTNSDRESSAACAFPLEGEQFQATICPQDFCLFSQFC